MNKNCRDRVLSFKVSNGIDSDHMPLKLIIRRGKYKDRKEEEDQARRQEKKRVVRLDEEARSIYKENTEKVKWSEKAEDNSIEAKWARLKEIIKGDRRLW